MKAIITVIQRGSALQETLWVSHYVLSLSATRSVQVEAVVHLQVLQRLVLPLDSAEDLKEGMHSCKS
jgi:hypothetical protein